VSPNVVCQQSFFAFSVRPSGAAHVLLAGVDLGAGPGSHGFLSHALEVLGHAQFGIIGEFEVACGVVHRCQQ